MTNRPAAKTYADAGVDLAAAAAVNAVRALQREKISVKSLQEYHEKERQPG